jgi:hypothetical protein
MIVLAWLLMQFLNLEKQVKGMAELDKGDLEKQGNFLPT